MVKNLVLNMKVSGVRGQVLEPADVMPSNAKDLLVGTIVAQVGQGKGRRWSVKWDNPARTTNCITRRLSPFTPVSDVHLDSNIDSDDSQSGSESEDPAEEDDTALIDPANSAEVVVHGVTWTVTGVVNRNSWMGSRMQFRIRWPNDLPMENRLPVDFFLTLFPPDLVKAMCTYTSENLIRTHSSKLEISEAHVFFGLFLAMSLVSYPTRRQYWSQQSVGGVFSGPNFGKFGMSVNRFESILRNLSFSPTSTIDDPWSQAKAIVSIFNNNRVQLVQPSWQLTADEKMSSYRPRKGSYLNDGIPHLTKIIRKPKPVGTELKDLTDASSRVTLQLEIQEGKVAMAAKEFAGEHSAGTALLLRLTKPWWNTDRHVFGDSAFASVAATVALKAHGLEFTGLVKTAHRMFPQKVLNQLPLPSKGDHAVMTATHLDTHMLAVTWNGGKVRKNIVSSCGVTTLAATGAKRERWVNNDDGITSRMVTKETPWPSIVAQYFEAASASDVNNHLRQGSLAMEEVWGTQTWWHRILATVVGICEVDSFLAFAALHPRGSETTHREFVEAVASGLLNSALPNGSKFRKRTIDGVSEEVPEYHRLRLLSDSPLARNFKEGARVQRECTQCSAKASYYCDYCSDVLNGVYFTVCGPGTSTEGQCFADHIYGK
jgi:hypothetical protein